MTGAAISQARAWSAQNERRGAALLLVLATLVLVVGATASLAHLAGTSAARRSLARRTATADDLLLQADAIVRRWLEDESEGIVLAPDALTPEVSVLHDAWVADDLEYELGISAWDQNGMVPLELADGGSPLRSTLPAEVRSLLDRCGKEVSGLDQLDVDGSPSPFAASSANVPVLFGEARPSPPSFADMSASPLAAGGWIATHPAGSRRVNVNTAPWPLVEAAMRAAGAGDPETVRAAREKGLATNVPAGASPPSSGPILVSRSDAWAFRIDISVANLTRSWWTVYHRTEQEWLVVQRLPVRR